jgi:hypothetical protein
MLLDVTLEPRKVKKLEVKEESARYNWEYENSINSGKEPIDMDSPQPFKYSQWRTNLSLSNFPETLLHSHMMNMCYHLKDKLHYQYLFHSVRKAKRYGKKKTDEEKRLEKQMEKEYDTILLIQNYYKYSLVRAKEAYKILTEEQIEMIRKKQEKGGIK